MSWTPTGPWYVEKPPQFIEEATYGVTPTDPTFVYCGPIVDMTHNHEVGYMDVRQIGFRDLYSQIQTGVDYSFDITYNPIDNKMLNYGIALPAGTGTVEKSITLLISQLINGTEYYLIYRGCRCDSTDLEITSDSAVEVSQTWFAKELTINTTGIAGTPTYVTKNDVTGVAVPWTNLDGTTTTASPLTWNFGGSPAVNTDVNSFSLSVSNNLERIKPNGQLTNKFVEPTLRDIEWEFATWLGTGKEDAAVDTYWTNEATSPTDRPMRYVVKAGVGGLALDFTKARINSVTSSDATSATESKMMELAGKAATLAVTTL